MCRWWPKSISDYAVSAAVRALAASAALALAACASEPACSPAAAGRDAHRLGPGDIVAINIFGEGDLSWPFTIDADGNMDYPPLGVIRAEGLTTDELRRAIRDAMGCCFVREPMIEVALLVWFTCDDRIRLDSNGASVSSAPTHARTTPWISI